MTVLPRYQPSAAGLAGKYDHPLDAPYETALHYVRLPRL
jgi:hypothetical protein